MTKQEGVKALSRVFGKKAMWRVNDKASSAQERTDAFCALAEARAREAAAKNARDERYRAILAADGEYQTLLAEYKQATADRECLLSRSLSYRVTIGRNEGMFFAVEAQGDNWADALRQLKSKMDGGK